MGELSFLHSTQVFARSDHCVANLVYMPLCQGYLSCMNDDVNDNGTNHKSTHSVTVLMGFILLDIVYKCISARVIYVDQIERLHKNLSSKASYTNAWF